MLRFCICREELIRHGYLRYLSLWKRSNDLHVWKEIRQSYRGLQEEVVANSVVIFLSEIIKATRR
jgi:hypothetical protein